MKIRIGFVSNSSSSSFVMVGFAAYRREEIVAQICKKHELKFYDINVNDDEDEEDIWDYAQYGPVEGENALSFYGNEGYLEWVGWNAENGLLENQTVAQVREQLIEYLATEYGVEVSPEAIRLVGDETAY